MHGIKEIKELNERAAKNQTPLPQPVPGVSQPEQK